MSVALNDVTISDNSAVSSNYGDGNIIHLESSGTLTLDGSTIRDNTGTGIHYNGTMTAEGSTISSNSDGGVVGTGTMDLTSCELDTNATENDGGAIRFVGTINTWNNGPWEHWTPWWRHPPDRYDQ